MSATTTHYLQVLGHGESIRGIDRLGKVGIRGGRGLEGEVGDKGLGIGEGVLD